MDEVELIAKARAGDLDAFEGVVRLFQGKLRAFLAMREDDRNLVDEMSQDAFVVAFQKLETFDQSKPFYPWLKGIALNIQRNEMRKRQKSDLPVDVAALVKLLDEVALERADQLEKYMGNISIFEALNDCRDRLEKTARQVVDDHYSLGYSLAATAVRAGKSTKAVSVALVRIRRALRQCIERKVPGQA